MFFPLKTTINLVIVVYMPLLFIHILLCWFISLWEGGEGRNLPWHCWLGRNFDLFKYISLKQSNSIRQSWNVLIDWTKSIRAYFEPWLKIHIPTMQMTTIVVWWKFVKEKKRYGDEVCNHIYRHVTLFAKLHIHSFHYHN